MLRAVAELALGAHWECLRAFEPGLARVLAEQVLAVAQAVAHVAGQVVAGQAPAAVAPELVAAQVAAQLAAQLAEPMAAEQQLGPNQLARVVAEQAVEQVVGTAAGLVLAAGRVAAVEQVVVPSR